MGMAGTIGELRAANRSFQAFLDDRFAALGGTISQATGDVAKALDDFETTNGWHDAASLIKGTALHTGIAEDWALDKVVAKVKEFQAAAVSGGPADGVDTPAQSPEVKAAVAKLSGLGVLIDSAALAAVLGGLETLSDGVTTQTRTVTGLAPGLTLALETIGSNSHSQEFLNEQTIMQSVFVFDARFSITVAGDVATFDLKSALQHQADALKAMVDSCDKALASLDPTADDYDVRSGRYEAIQAKATAQVEAVEQELRKVSATP